MKRRTEKQKHQGLLGMIGHVVKLELTKSPGLFLLFILLTVGSGVCTAANVFFKQTFFDSVEDLVKGESTISFAVGCGIVMALFLVFNRILLAAEDVILENVNLTAMGHMGKLLNEKASHIDPVVYEDNRFLDHINKAYAGMEASVMVVFSALIIVLEELAFFVFMGWYFYTIKPMLLVMFGISFLPTIAGSFIRRNMYAKLENQAAPYRRKYEYFEKCICSREYAKETRLWRAEKYFKKLYERNLGKFTELNWKTTKHSELVELALRFLLLSGYVGTIILLFYYLFQGEIGVGAFAAIFSSLDQMFDRMENVFNYRIGDITRGFGAAQNYYAFLNLKEREGTSKEPLKRETLELKGVSFTYPGSNKPALEDIDLTVRKGETIAIVGVNGSGKSTLTRLLTGLYLPTSGELAIDGRNVGDIAPEVLYQGVSAVFQRYQSYKMTVEENTRISEMEKGTAADDRRSVKSRAEGVAGAERTMAEDAALEDAAETTGKDKPETAEKAARGAAVRDALEKADFTIDSEKLTEGLNTMLGKDFGGIDLSGGQWQRLAIARGLYRDHDMIILDEPTAAIDPLQEAAIYHKFAEISKDKTAFIVTHRLGSAQIADRIIVMDAGHIVDMGTHEELMKREGKYREMYQAQAKWYV